MSGGIQKVCAKLRYASVVMLVQAESSPTRRSIQPSVHSPSPMRWQLVQAAASGLTSCLGMVQPWPSLLTIVYGASA